jgi:hypothetical protein
MGLRARERCAIMGSRTRLLDDRQNARESGELVNFTGEEPDFTGEERGRGGGSGVNKAGQCFFERRSLTLAAFSSLEFPLRAFDFSAGGIGYANAAQTAQIFTGAWAAPRTRPGALHPMTRGITRDHRRTSDEVIEFLAPSMLPTPNLFAVSAREHANTFSAAPLTQGG